MTHFAFAHGSTLGKAANTYVPPMQIDIFEGENGEIPTGCGWHPNVADHERMAAILKKELSAKLGW